MKTNGMLCVPSTKFSDLII